jgi:hypothetical protein
MIAGVKQMTTSLQAKLISLVQYCELQRSNLLSTTAKEFRDRLLDDPEVAQWVDQHKNESLYNMRQIR